MTKKLEGAGLRGQVAGETSLSTVGQIEGLAYSCLLYTSPSPRDRH